MKLAAAVMAGGRSRRMGTDKALLPVRGHACLLARQIALLRSIRPAEVLLSCRRGQFSMAIPNVRPVFDDGRQGPLGGLSALLHATRSDAVFVLAVDLPRMSESLVRQIAAHARVSPCKGAVPRTRSGIEPLAAVFPAAMRELVDHQLRRSNDRSLQALIREGVSQGFLDWFPVGDSAVAEFYNWNLPGTPGGV